MDNQQAMVPILLKVTPELKGKIKLAAKQSKRSMQSQIFWMLEQLLKD